ncbi:MAG: nitronate monooxygenase [Thermomicrobiales bacterium]|nr:nitronate monooxygenase [Thermomicrobiales bacterium]
MIATPLCRLLGIEHPVINASMSGTATGVLAAAVANAGGFGMIGGTSAGGADWLREQIAVARRHTSRPFGVGFISSFPDTVDLVAVALEAGVAAINHSFADPAPYVAPAHEAGVKVFAQVQSLAAATQAARAGVDVIIAQGGEAGGHAGRTGTFALLPAIVDAVAPVPVVAAGGIADGRGLAAALLLGAQGVWMGTRFLATPEWGGQVWKQHAVLAATADDTLQTSVYDRLLERPFPEGINDRVVRNAFNAQWQAKLAEVHPGNQPLLEQLLRARERGDTSIAGVSAGVSSGLIIAIEPAADIVHTIVRDAEDLLRRRPGQLLGPAS